MQQELTRTGNAVITGASKGIGRALAIALSRAGWRVALLARNEEGLAETEARLSNQSKKHLVVPCDISMWNECQRAHERIAEEFGDLNVLVNNAFGYGESQLSEMDPGQIHDFFAISVTGTALITKSLLPVLERGYTVSQRKSQIVNIVADWGFPMHNVMSGPSVYVSGKYAIHGFGVALHRETAPHGVNVSNLYPGIVASDLDIDVPVEVVRQQKGASAIPVIDITRLVIGILGLESSVVRHLVISPDNPDYNGL
jgi:3-oxoacyl-[acyl-carrier protein] reductase